MNLLTTPSTRLRTMPLRVPFPLRREHEIVIHQYDEIIHDVIFALRLADELRKFLRADPTQSCGSLKR